LYPGLAGFIGDDGSGREPFPNSVFVGRANRSAALPATENNRGEQSEDRRLYPNLLGSELGGNARLEIIDSSGQAGDFGLLLELNGHEGDETGIIGAGL
jgi:hypothetical protein